MKVIVTCEHGGNKVPAGYSTAFKNAKQVLNTHRGYDIGALDLYQQFSSIADFSIYSTTSRLVVELNRSLHHPKLFSEFMQPLTTTQAEKVLAEHYYPYRQKAEAQIADWVQHDFTVVHVSVHSFTPELNGKVRKADVGLLYDPKREREQLLAARWRQQMQMVSPDLKIRYNYPYKGTADGFITQVRKNYTNEQYAGLELEVNQRFPIKGTDEWQQLKTDLIQTFSRAL
ncbi:N-formylglutamate amidohydrolase [Rufibacter latericius]|uniref:N-formylglutamate amidohydrolase n=1 Tax=Rufibacter latericius TaxID=2487040 RepID=A0A3M9MZ62_9BACT|nr:N-formylglutamate amidohydrolase [Rufibacter latericius]